MECKYQTAEEIINKIKEKGYSIKPSSALTKAKEICKVAENKEEIDWLVQIEVDLYLTYVEDIRQQNQGV